MGKFDLNPDEMKKFDLKPDELAPKSKYPPTKSETQDDQALGLETGATERRGVFEPGFPGNVNRPIGSEIKKLHDAAILQAQKEMMANFGGQVAGSALVPIAGELVAPAFGRAAAGRVASSAPNALSNFAKGAPSVMELSKIAINGAAKKIGTMAMGEAGANAVAELAKRGIAVAPEAIGNLSVGAATKATPIVAGAVAGEAVSKSEPESEPKPYKGVFSNAIDRLRSQPATNVRAQELLKRLDSMGAGTQTVTQTQGAP